MNAGGGVGVSGAAVDACFALLKRGIGGCGGAAVRGLVVSVLVVLIDGAL